MCVVYAIMRNERALIEPLWKIVDEYVEISRADNVKFAMVARAMPEIRASLVEITEYLDESLCIVYDSGGQIDVAAWQSMDLTSRLLSLRLCTFKYEHVCRFHDIYTYDIINLAVAIELINDIVCESGLWCRRSSETYPLKTRFACELFNTCVD